MERRRSLKVAVSERYSSREIRSQLAHRDRLRIPAEMTLFFCHRDAYAPARLVNMSRGGLHFGSEIFLAPGARLTLYMPNLGRGYESLFETTVDVVWSAKRVPRRGMGVRFRELTPDTERQLDDYVVSFLRERLSKANRLDYRPSLVGLASPPLTGARG
jgi:c-di-GMP-binding flagellar brake protein YcgR